MRSRTRECQLKPGSQTDRNILGIKRNKVKLAQLGGDVVEVYFVAVLHGIGIGQRHRERTNFRGVFAFREFMQVVAGVDDVEGLYDAPEQQTLLNTLVIAMTAVGKSHEELIVA